ncbi:hypothetical protein MIND_00209200 [Mycena indigotica]|uniref:Uncharacterized protein n=1 Tax=Mycena indigotica TaxID=2126181 RepID=A0A8H6T4K7_9AGAR|nr:uncharacterized protein MIND_00209200 [Mycena indigotica]KAF7311975.1 hypothetical protein MIND_00209200 [Mycena indigotica]
MSPEFSMPPSAIQFVPQDGVFAVLTIDPIDSLGHLEDQVALDAASSLTFKDYIVFVPGTDDLRHPDIEYRAEDVEFVLPGLPNDVPDLFITSSMSLPIAPTLDTHHPTREPLQTVGELPWAGGFLSPFFSTTVRTKTVMRVDPIVCELGIRERLRHRRCGDQDRKARAEAAQAARVTPSPDEDDQSIVYNANSDQFDAPGADAVPLPDCSSVEGGEVEQHDDSAELDFIRHALFAPQRSTSEDMLTVKFTHNLLQVSSFNNPGDFFHERDAIARITRESFERRLARAQAQDAVTAARYAGVKEEFSENAVPSASKRSVLVGEDVPKQSALTRCLHVLKRILCIST